MVNVDQMLRSLTYKQFLEWQKFYELEPFGELRQDYRTAQIVAMLANINRDVKKHPEPYKIEEFLLPFGEGDNLPVRKRTQTWQQQMAVARSIVAAFSKERANE